MRTRIFVPIASALLLAGCGGQSTRSDSTRSATSTSASTVAATQSSDPAPCRPAPLHHGPPPAWTAAAWSDSSPGFTLPYALSSGDTAGAFFFANPVRAGRPANPSNKVLWIVRFPRNGNPLRITARFGADPALVVRASWPADSQPGEIYPSSLDLPRPGCWALTLAWGQHRTSIDVHVSAPARRKRS
jgi:uncharacterized protein YceK